MRQLLLIEIADLVPRRKPAVALDPKVRDQLVDLMARVIAVVHEAGTSGPSEGPTCRAEVTGDDEREGRGHGDSTQP